MSGIASKGTAPVEEAPLRALLDGVNQVLLGKEEAVRLAVAGLLARGHLLIEDLPGVGKTTLAHALARLVGLDLQRIQFTSDMLPADIIGASVYERATGGFVFHQGPLFAQMVLADEVNRATPKTQSALLEAMGEGQVTVEGETRPLPEPFFVIATQNPLHQIGTFPLPESQLDRFLLRLTLGYPDARAERELLEGEDRGALVQRMAPVMAPEDLASLQEAVPRVHAAPPLLDYIQALLGHTREAGRFRSGLSPRAGLALLRAAQAWALVDGREAVLPEDVQAVFPAVAGHRLHPAGAAEGQSGDAHAAAVLDEVAIP
ncbi:AAA family ATPase [Thiohalorhabdus denitrificans]|uniref:MoxR-like ATPase n=1 Tax=Thiohalorhabdus denitrificans TaxID=381306 RepID=A0A0P9C4G9_9GAMM|nr:MoxR family ATPase [Thiohalorhabdus denitrificans]KPV39690.1 AAA family ATPase [Thiohalorhabdus denitrificans]SCX93837.1 MoxR-like ATPase [Thiohalorhabdus denitrificans]